MTTTTNTVKRQKVWISKTTTLAARASGFFFFFLYISVPKLHDYDVKVPNFTFCEDMNSSRRERFSNFFFKLRYSPLEFNSRKIYK